MTTTIKAKYRNGAIELLEQVSIPEGKELSVSFEQPATPKEDSWNDNTAYDLADRLAKIEAELPEDEVAKWHSSMSRAGKPAQYVEGRGIVVDYEQ